MYLKSFVVLCAFLSVPVFLLAQSQPASDPQALTYAAQAIAAITGGTPISDVTYTGSVTWNGSGSGTGTATLQALGTNESRMDLALSGGTRTEIRDAQTGTSIGEWVNPDTTSGQFASQNCQTDAVWFFPVLGALSVPPNVVLSYIGQETRNGEAVQHVQSYVYQPNTQSGSPTLQQLTTIDFYLDASTFLPAAVTFNSHPDNDAATNLLVETDFTNYQSMSGGVMVPTHIQRYLQSDLLVDLTVSAATFNTGLSLSIFAIN